MAGCLPVEICSSARTMLSSWPRSKRTQRQIPGQMRPNQCQAYSLSKIHTPLIPAGTRGAVSRGSTHLTAGEPSLWRCNGRSRNWILGSPAHSRVVFTGGWQRRLSVCGLLSLLVTCPVTRPGHRINFIIPHFALRANHFPERVGGHPITASSFPTLPKTSSPLSRSSRECDALTITRMRALPLGTVGKPIAIANTP